ncbi:MAG: hypothetical protein U0838_16040 [Chloroflexota bacterium]
MLRSVRLGFVLRRGLLFLLVIALVGVLIAVGRACRSRSRHLGPPLVYSPPVLAGQGLGYGCSGGVYAKTKDDAIVLTTTGHCLTEGMTALRADGVPIGKASAWSNWSTCDKPGKNRCTSSDMAYITLLPEVIAWGHLDQIDMGAGGYVTVAPGTRALACPDIHEGDEVRFNGRSIYRTGKVVSQEAYNFDGDGTFFPCIVISDVQAGGGDSGGVVLVRGLPAGVGARVFGSDQWMGFTPLGPGLEELGLTLCDSPNCGLTPAAVQSPGAESGTTSQP